VAQLLLLLLHCLQELGLMGTVVIEPDQQVISPDWWVDW